MDIEQLKMILEAVTSATDGATEFAIWMIAINFSKALLGYLLAGVGIFAAYRLIKKIIAACTEDSWARNLRGISDPRSNYGSLTESEKKRILDLLRKGKASE